MAIKGHPQALVQASYRFSTGSGAGELSDDQIHLLSLAESIGLFCWTDIFNFVVDVVHLPELEWLLKMVVF